MDFELKGKVKEYVYDIDTYIPGKMVEGYVKLASNENNYGPSPKVVEALRECANKVNIYPYREDEVRESIAEYCGLSKENITVGNGSDELIELILKVFRGPVLCFNPTFGEYRISSQILGESYSSINLEQDFSFPLGRYMRKAVEANILVLCSPNNPTGKAIPQKDIKKILELGKPTVVDEAYFEFCGETTTSLLEEYGNLIVLRTFSKAFALGGLRIGYAIASPKVVELLYKVRQPFSVNSFAQVAALAALDDVAFMEGNMEKIKEDRKMLYRKLGERFRAYESDANFVLLDSSPITSRELFDRLYEKKIIVRRLGRFPGFEGDFTRITVGTSEENKKLIQALEGI
ncbi:MAG: histidinol-phosphate transaminase [Candidatus Altiarchaeota archaeon]|nr:histidinol-phosphate transaminase [Candidatus Altiarchaeota archaeon]